jgi:EAL domain-containing protein (putative c-di-GMP-specific phosphodiesterase class I)
MADWTADEHEFGAILRERRLRAVFQPILELSSGATVGYEALIRGPAGSPFVTADALLAEAYRIRRVIEFDWVARAVACRAALAAELSPDCLLFLNIEPLALDSASPHDLWPDIEAAFSRLRVVLEVTERSLLGDPAALLNGIGHNKSMVAGVALDDVGSSPVTVSMLSLLGPTVIKLDRWVIAQAPAPGALRVLEVAYQEAERTGALILAEGIETAAQLELARSLGVPLGQGRYLGRPAALPRTAPPTKRVELAPLAAEVHATPFDALRGRVAGRAPAKVLAPLANQLAQRNADLTHPGVFLVLVPEPGMLDPIQQHRLATLAQHGVLAAVLGTDLPGDLGPGVQASALRPGDKLSREWAVVSLGPDGTSAFLARTASGAHTADAEYEFGVTHDPQRVIAAARSLVKRLGSTSGAPGAER